MRVSLINRMEVSVIHLLIVSLGGTITKFKRLRPIRQIIHKKSLNLHLRETMSILDVLYQMVMVILIRFTLSQAHSKNLDLQDVWSKSNTMELEQHQDCLEKHLLRICFQECQMLYKG